MAKGMNKWFVDVFDEKKMEWGSVWILKGMEEKKGGVPMSLKTRGTERDVSDFCMNGGRQRTTADAKRKEKEVC